MKITLDLDELNEKLEEEYQSGRVEALIEFMDLDQEDQENLKDELRAELKEEMRDELLKGKEDFESKLVDDIDCYLSYAANKMLSKLETDKDFKSELTRKLLK